MSILSFPGAAARRLPRLPHAPYFRRGGIVLYHGDSIEIMRQLRAVDMIFTDPPYGSNQNREDLNAKVATILGRKRPEPRQEILNDGPEAHTLFATMLAEAQRLLPPGGVAASCCHGGAGSNPAYARWATLLDEHLGMKQAVVWDKGPMGLGWHYHRSYEFVLVGQKAGKAKWYDTTRRIENVIRPGMHGIKKVHGRHRIHPTEKPPELAALFIRLHTLPGELVLDPFAGSGSTLVAAAREGRLAIGIELDERWCEAAAKRLDAELASGEAKRRAA